MCLTSVGVCLCDSVLYPGVLHFGACVLVRQLTAAAAMCVLLCSWFEVWGCNLHVPRLLLRLQPSILRVDQAAQPSVLQPPVSPACDYGCVRQ
jgi:hypothetical protein